MIHFTRISLQSHGPLLIALASLLAWFLVYTLARDRPLVDESNHLQAIIAIDRGQFQLRDDLPMWPGYHWIAAVFSYLLGPSLTMARLVTFLMSSAAVGLYWLAIRNWRGSDAGRLVLLFAWLPILFPFTAMAYTDAPALMFVVGALWAMTDKRYLQVSIWMLAACLVRQSNVVWVAFFVAWISLDFWEELRQQSDNRPVIWSAATLRVWLSRTAGLLVLLGVAVMVFAVRGSLLPRPTPGQDPGPNIAQLYLAGFFVLGLWLPVWATRIGDEVRFLLARVQRQPVLAGFSAVALIAAGAFLAGTYDNPHGSNAVRIVVIRNTPLTYMDELPFVRILGVILLLVTGWLLVRFWRSQPERRYLILAGIFSFLFLLPHALADPRYYIVPFVITGFFTVYTRRQEQLMIAWYSIVSVVICLVILKYGWIW